MTVHKHQMDRPSHGGAPCGARSVYALGAHDERQDWSLRSGQGSLTYCLNRRLRLVATRRSQLIHVTLRLPPYAVERHRRGSSRTSRHCCPATFNLRRAIRSGCGTLSRAFQHFVRQDLYVPECHSFNASLVRWFNTDEPRTEAARKNGNPFQQKE